MQFRSVDLVDIQEQIRALAGDIWHNAGRAIIEDGGTPVAALISLRDLDHLNQLDMRREEVWAAIQALRSRFEDVPEEELMAEALKAQKEAREDMDRERAAAIAAIRATDPTLPGNELLETAQLAVRRAWPHP